MKEKQRAMRKKMSGQIILEKITYHTKRIP